MDNLDATEVISLKNSDFKSFDKLFDKYGKKLYRFALGYLKSREDAEGLVLDVFMKVWENRASLDETKSFNSYLFTIAKNTILNHFRKKANQKSYLEYIKQHTELIYANTEDNNLENDILFSNLESQAKLIIDRLPSRRKEIYLLSREKGYCNEIIAQTLNISKKTVENQITLALKFIKEQLRNKDLIPLLFFSLFI